MSCAVFALLLTALSCCVLQPSWEPYLQEYGTYVDIAFSWSAHIWPWSGYLSISIAVTEAAKQWLGVAKGQVTLTIESPPDRVRADVFLINDALIHVCSNTVCR